MVAQFYQKSRDRTAERKRCSVTDYESGEMHFNVKAGRYYVYPDLRSMDELSLDPKLDKRKLEIEVLPGSTNEVGFMMTPRR